TAMPAASQAFPERDRAWAKVACTNEDFERLKAMMDDQVRKSRRRERKAWEAAGMAVVGCLLLVGTALGDGMLSGGPDVTAGAEPQPEAARRVLAAEAEADTEEALAEHDAVLPVPVARAVAVVYASGRQVGHGRHFDVRLTSAARRAIRSVGVDVPPRSASAASREAALITGLARLVEDLGSLEAALVCLRMDRDLVETALDLAYGSNLPNPDAFESFARYLPHAARRRAEGPTRRVMALAIGYDMSWPVHEAARVSSGFGPRVHPVLGEPMMHYGTDLAVDEGTAIRAMADGYVVYSKRDAVNGKFVKLDHGYGLTSAYVHNSELLVGEGERVKKGQLIARSGATGRATGPHLHFQVEIDNRPIDPEAFRERKAPRAHRKSVEAESIGDAIVPP
ncbi:MAG: M23 family metallopeptidase, partial [Myxococcota bacterium]